MKAGGRAIALSSPMPYIASSCFLPLKKMALRDSTA